MISAPIAFHRQAEAALADGQLRGHFRQAMDFLTSKRARVLPDREAFLALRQQAEAIRRHSLAHLPTLLEQLEQQLTANGIHVHWAETPDEANALIVKICREANCRLVVKGKSMVSEEIEFNHAAQQNGIDALETDMGEYIVQLAGEKPSHIIMPAIHKTKADIAQLFSSKIKDVDYTEDVDALIQIGRRVLRQAFAQAEVGLSGVNFAVAETGSLCLVENEGNGRMCTTVPKVHIAITGIEKVIARLDDLPPLLALLPRSATGQAITTYINLIQRPRQPSERDGPEAVHLILLDNGRSRAYADASKRDALLCIRCGACMNHCPVYGRIGGHAYGTTYPGPIGSIVSPHLIGLAATADLPTASSLCGACADVCPVGVPIPKLLLRWRQTLASGNDPTVPRRRLEWLCWRLWRWINTSAWRYQRAMALAALAAPLIARLPQGGWSRGRAPLTPAPRRLRDFINQRNRRS